MIVPSGCHFEYGAHELRQIRMLRTILESKRNRSFISKESFELLRHMV